MNRYIFILLISLIAQGIGAFGQESADSSKQRFITKASYHNGVLLPHRIAMQHIPKTTTHGFELNFEKVASNTANWEKLYNNPTYGVSMLYTSTGNKELMGNAFGINAYLLLPLVSTGNFRMQTSWGWGVGIVGKKFNRLTNYKNNAIGSNFNLFASIKLKAEYYVAPKDALLFGAAFNHWSNSGIRKPNLGINIPTWSIGYLHKFYEPTERPNKLTKLEKKAYKPEIKNEFIAMPIIGFTSVSIHDQNIYQAYAIQLNYARLWSALYKVNWSLDFFYNTSFRKQMEADPNYANNTAFQTGIMASYEQTVGRVGLLLGMGAYVFDQTNRKDPIYHRFGTRVYLADNFLIHTTLHTHWAVSDHMEIGFGYRFKK